MMNSGELFDVAKEAVASLDGMGERQYIKRKPLVAAAFSALSCEAFINEVFALCEPPSPPGWATPPAQLKKLWCTAQSLERASTLDKYQEARKALTGKRYAKGRSPFQDFALLFDVRSAIVHAKPLDETEWVSLSGGTVTSRIRKHHPILKKLRSKKLAVKPPRDDSWIIAISTPALGMWACNTAAQMVGSIVCSMPEGLVKEGLSAWHHKHFVLT